MKTRFASIDIKATVNELQNRLLGLRVLNVYDVDSKTYLIKLTKLDQKEVLLLESGIRFHTTDFEWPKNVMPSGFAMKMRKHLKSRRLEKIQQVGEDRIIDIQFGSGEAAYHVILELYDRGNLILTDFEYTILNILRPRTDESQDVRYAVREKYPLECAKQCEEQMTADRLSSILASAKEGDNLKKVLLPQFAYGPAVLDHCLLVSGIQSNAKVGKDICTVNDVDKLLAAFHLADSVVADVAGGASKGFIIQKVEKSAGLEPGMETTDIYTYVEFHPYLFVQYTTGMPYLQYESFNKAVDEFFSKIESQKLDIKIIQQEKAALKKLENVKKDHQKRLEELETEQATDARKAQLIEINLTLVDRAITVVRSLLASQLDWLEIEKMVNDAANQRDPVASSIKSLKLQSNHITMLLQPRGVTAFDVDDSNDEDDFADLKPAKVDIDLGLSAYANARRYFDMKRHASQKQQKTINASEKALKSAERKTKETLKEAKTVATIIKARKTYWFEKFYWCISSENYLIIGGRDQQQNEVIVKRYLKPGDLYVHADLHGASSVVIKNPSKEPVPPKTLNEAGSMALCYSAAWEAKVITSAWWVYHDQVSKTAPSGEYLTTGSFMIRGKKNFLTPSHLIYGFGFLFKIDDSCIAQHKSERRVRTVEEDDDSLSAIDKEPSSTGDVASISDVKDDESEDQELEGELSGDDSHDSDSLQDADKQSDDFDMSADCEQPAESEVGDHSLSSDKRSSPSNDKQNTSCSEIATGVSAIQLAASNSAAGVSVKTEEDEFPDTSIRVQYIGGDKYAIQTSVESQQKTPNSSTKYQEDGPQHLFLGDDKPLILGEKSSGKQSGRLSAKQRREMKKSHQVQFAASNEENEEKDTESNRKQQQSLSQQPGKNEKSAAVNKSQQVQPKRGQKSKLKKIQEKYGDQDEEERQLRLEILASAGVQKSAMKGKKGKKGEEGKSSSKSGKPRQQQTGQQRMKGPLTIKDIADETAVITDGDNSAVPQPEDQINEDDEDELSAVSQDAAILDTLTGIPLPEDILLFCVPVCAPYSALTNYRYKVKLTPGTTKRGKAAKTSLDVFLRDRSTTQREKDLFRSVKDTDLSRNMPGKVKVSAPNLHRQKHK